MTFDLSGDGNSVSRQNVDNAPTLAESAAFGTLDDVLGQVGAPSTTMPLPGVMLPGTFGGGGGGSSKAPGGTPAPAQPAASDTSGTTALLVGGGIVLGGALLIGAIYLAKKKKR